MWLPSSACPFSEGQAVLGSRAKLGKGEKRHLHVEGAPLEVCPGTDHHHHPSLAAEQTMPAVSQPSKYWLYHPLP